MGRPVNKAGGLGAGKRLNGWAEHQFSVSGKELGSGTAVTCMFKLDKEWLLFYLLIPRCYVEIKRPRIGFGVIKEWKMSGQSGIGPCRWLFRR